MVTDVRIILRENVFEYDDDGEAVGVYSTVGIKFKYKGQQYGQYIRISKAFLEAIDVVQTTNRLLKTIEEVVAKFG